MFKWNRPTNDPAVKTFAELFKTLSKTSKEPVGNRAPEFVRTILFSKLPIQIQYDLCRGGKANASVQELKGFIQRQIQYQQLVRLRHRPCHSVKSPRAMADLNTAKVPFHKCTSKVQ